MYLFIYTNKSLFFENILKIKKQKLRNELTKFWVLFEITKTKLIWVKRINAEGDAQF